MPTSQRANRFGAERPLRHVGIDRDTDDQTAASDHELRQFLQRTTSASQVPLHVEDHEVLERIARVLS
jgi:hypothetical protein